MGQREKGLSAILTPPLMPLYFLSPGTSDQDQGAEQTMISLEKSKSECEDPCHATSQWDHGDEKLQVSGLYSQVLVFLNELHVSRATRLENQAAR